MKKPTYIQNSNDAQQWCKQLGLEPVIGLDIETYPKPQYQHIPKAAVDPYLAHIRLVSIADLHGHVVVIDVRHVPIAVLQPLTLVPWIVHNGSFEYRHLTFTGLHVPRLHDTQLLYRLHTGREHASLKQVALDVLRTDIDKTEQTSDWGVEQLTDDQIHYAGMDAEVALQAAQVMLDEVISRGQKAVYDLWCRALPVLAQSQLDGLRFDWAAHKALYEQWDIDLKQKRSELTPYFGPNVNVDRSKKINQWLNDHIPSGMLVNWPRTKKGWLSTTKHTLSLYAHLHPALDELRRYKEMKHNLSTYGQNFCKYRHVYTDCIHPDFFIGCTDTGRLNTANPSVQNIPKSNKVRTLFIAPPGYSLIRADYSQIELRVAAAMSNDPVMIDAYQSGQDVHTSTARAMVGPDYDQLSKDERGQHRFKAKAVNFGTLYGQSPKGLAEIAKTSYKLDMTVEQAKQFQDQFYRTYATYKRWGERQIAKAKAPNIGKVFTRMGLMRSFRGPGQGNVKGYALNTPIQGSAAEVLLSALVRLPDALAEYDARLYNNIHDEVVLQVRDDQIAEVARILNQTMVQGFLDVFPEGEALTGNLVEMTAGKNWADTIGIEKYLKRGSCGGFAL